MRPYNRYSSAGLTTDAVTFDTTDALRLDTSVRPYNRYSSHRSTTDALRLDTSVRPYTRYTSRFDTTDAQIVRPYTSYS